MGLFTPRPEEPAEWAGLPSEPLEPVHAVDSLDPATGYTDPLRVLGPAVQSIVIPVVVPVAEPGPPAADTAEREASEPTPE
ncbi:MULTISPECIES: hypothetical protein [unclassified Microbacterium]|uniref:hypothetical protein n=1 Tax=unclassified Microbacterium TaxID=2609290 RepID=UPI00214B2919|nr:MULTISPECIES: hypothetical protein [unclassified Microbacterium]MCR2809226.1 hypothetical protein [Microbacterium sp. zg.B185]WIM20373.1 hypothetical protein QNO12_06115 [Microbacterium sp. zg-B185]